jgi:two-component system NtrC family sensor kinase
VRIGRRRRARGSPPEAVGSRGTALATIGLTVVLALLTAICTWAAWDATVSSGQATYQLRIASAQEAELEAVLAEHAAQLHYLECSLAFDPGACTAQERTAYEEARRRLRVALQQVQAAGDASDRAGAAYIDLLEGRYDLTVQRQFAAIDGGREVQARRLERDEAGPEIEQVLQLVRGAADTHQARAASGIGQLGERTERSARLIPVVFGFAFLLLGGCWAVLWSLQRRLRRQAGALIREKALLDGVISAIPHLVYWKDGTGRHQGMNRAFVQQRDADPDSEALPFMLAELERDVTHTGEAVMDHHVTVKGPDGRLRQLLLSVIPRPGAQGAPEGVIGVGTDITHIRELEHQLAQAQRLESLGQLASGVAHEINTPIQFLNDNTKFVIRSVAETLTALHAIAQLLAQDAPDPAALRRVLDPLDLAFLEQELPVALAESQAGLQRVAEIVRALREFSHPGQGRREADLNAAIESTVKVSRGEWKNVAEVHLDLDPELGTVPCYESELKQVLLNIVVNAAQAIAEGRPGPDAPLGHIRITTRRDPDQIRITVTDDGPGMSEAVLQRVFDPFFTTKDVGKGTGQGLAIAHATIVRKHAGTIGLSSRPGRGTTCLITLPITTRSAPQAEATARDPSAVPR